ncbi:hypothetical protein [Falsiroseomonas sp.]|uniref:hypothetical protein n=1 Tax=Falsiroseomonas sp. TaxID=2870721 RepID=UPI003F6E4EDE
MLLRTWPAETPAPHIARRLRCQACGTRPTCELVDNPQLDAPGYVSYGKPAVRIPMDE